MSETSLIHPEADVRRDGRVAGTLRPGGVMEQQPIFNYIWLGTALRYLMSATPGRGIHGEGLVLKNIASFQRDLNAYGLQVSSRAAENLLTEVVADLAKTDKDAVLDVDQANRLRDAFKVLREVIEAEAGGKVAFIVTDRRYAVSTLLEGMASLFPAGAFGRLPEMTQADMTEAGKCLAFELPTAAAFHVLRATEQVLREFYKSWVRTKRVKVLLWGAMTKDMRSRRTKPPDPLLNHLDHIREHFRNPTDHPEKIYDMEEAQNLLGLCCDAIGRMKQRQTAADRRKASAGVSGA